MLNKEKHQLIMGRILKDIYSDTGIAPLLGLKGGTCAYFFYGLPRFSVDLDFDLLTDEETAKKKVFEKIVKILSNYGEIKNQRIKRWTIFALLSYSKLDHNIKIEVNTRNLIKDIKNHYALKEYLGISMLAAKKEYLFTGKLAAFTTRAETAMRDVYDINYFLKNNWEIDLEVLNLLIGKRPKEYLTDCIKLVEQVKDAQILHGLGEFLSEKEKAWVKKNLKSETIFLLKNYQSVL